MISPHDPAAIRPFFGASFTGLSATMNDSGPLRSCVIEMGGDWRTPSMPAGRVVSRMRDVCLTGITLRSDRQPDGIYVENRASGPPAIWLHIAPAQTAWIITDVGERDWCRLAYQFGHELGHVLANSWQRDAAPQPPCQWLEEALVEAFSLRGLGLLADSWAQSPPFQGDEEFSDKIREYRTDILARYQGYATEWGAGDLRGMVPGPSGGSVKNQWPQRSGGVSGAGSARPVESNPVLIEDYGAMNRWPGRSAVPPAEYFRLWRESCAGIGSSAKLATWLGEELGEMER